MVLSLEELEVRLSRLEQGAGRHGVDSLGHQRTHGTDAHLPRNNFTATTTPGIVSDVSEGYGPGSEWINVALDKRFVCMDSTLGAAIWAEDLAASGAHDEAHGHSTHSDINSDDHHTQTHSHGELSVSHSNLTGVSADQHHQKLHDHDATGYISFGDLQSHSFEPT